MTDEMPVGCSPGPFVLHAPNVHVGGGRTLLLPILHALKPPATVLLDTRLSPLPEMSQGVDVLRFPPTLTGRLHAEWTLRRLIRPGTDILCFGNLPPLLASAPPAAVVFLQNRYLLPGASLTSLPVSVRLRLAIERLWLRIRRGKARIVVQSETIAIAASASLGGTVEICPFIPVSIEATDRAAPTIDYLYVASGEAHKNHKTLLSAWARLAADGLTPSLGLTLSAVERAQLAGSIRTAEASGARISFFDPRPTSQMPALYAMARAVIYPSLFESFGLPLIEAQTAGLPILAAERDYVRDIVDPVESFDPTSDRSIAKAVRRHLGQEPTRVPIRDATGFLAHVRSGR